MHVLFPIKRMEQIKDVMTIHRDKIKKASRGETKTLPLYTNDYYGQWRNWDFFSRGVSRKVIVNKLRKNFKIILYFFIG
jgi:hypothetical protein